jgi:dTMP kinase
MRVEKNFVVFEGIDGSGKGVQVELLKQYFEEKKRTDVVFTFEHTRQGPWSEEIEKIMHGQMPSPPHDKLQLLYILDRKDHLENVILPALKKGKTVFCDRYALSTLAYGSYDGSVHWKTLWNNHQEILGDNFIMPALTVFFDIEPARAFKRLRSTRGRITFFESPEKLARIRDAYLSIGKHIEGFKVVDGSGAPEEVFERTTPLLVQYL